MTAISELNQCPCEKLDPQCVDAYLELDLPLEAPERLVLASSWGETSVDLSPAVKASETVTTLKLLPTALQFNREDYGKDNAPDGGMDCITGDALSRIISMSHLKDVNQVPVSSGDVYMFDGELFQPYDLQSFIDETKKTLQEHGDQINNFNTQIKNLTDLVNNTYTGLTNAINQLTEAFNAFKTQTNNRLDAIEAVIAKPSYVPASARLAWGNTNTAKASAPSSNGIWTHNPSTNVVGDTRFD